MRNRVQVFETRLGIRQKNIETQKTWITTNFVRWKYQKLETIRSLSFESLHFKANFGTILLSKLKDVVEQIFMVAYYTFNVLAKRTINDFSQSCTSSSKYLLVFILTVQSTNKEQVNLENAPSLRADTNKTNSSPPPQSNLHNYNILLRWFMRKAPGQRARYRSKVEKSSVRSHAPWPCTALSTQILTLCAAYSYSLRGTFLLFARHILTLCAAYSYSLHGIFLLSARHILTLCAAYSYSSRKFKLIARCILFLFGANSYSLTNKILTHCEAYSFSFCGKFLLIARRILCIFVWNSCSLHGKFLLFAWRNESHCQPATKNTLWLSTASGMPEPK